MTEPSAAETNSAQAGRATRESNECGDAVVSGVVIPLRTGAYARIHPSAKASMPWRREQQCAVAARTDLDDICKVARMKCMPVGQHHAGASERSGAARREDERG